jgi:hypothetical protein
MGNLSTSMLNMPHDLYTISHITNPFLGYMLFNRGFLMLFVIVLWEVIEFIVIEVLGTYGFMYFDEDNPEAMIDVIIYDLLGGLLGIVLGMCTCLILYKSIYSPDARFKTICPLPKCIKCPDNLWYKNDWLSLLVYIFSVGPGPVSAVGWDCNEAFVEWGICNKNEYQLLPWGLLIMIFFDILVVLLLWRKPVERALIIFTQLAICVSSFQRSVPGSLIQLLTTLLLICTYGGIYLCDSKSRVPREDYKPIGNDVL